MVTPPPAGESSPRLGHTDGETFTVPGYSGRGKERKQSGEHTFTVSGNDGHSATVTSDSGGSYTMKRDAVKHFADDLNQRVDVPPHPSHAGINLIREGKAQFLGKGDDGLAFDTQDGQVAKVTTSVPYNLAYFRDHQHAIADARRQVELTNQAIADGHNLLVPQQFIEHGEKGFTIMPRLDLNAELTREQIIDYRNKMRAFTEAGWRVGDDVQTGVDDQGNIRIYDTGKLTRATPGDDDTWQQDRHPGKLLREHGHYDDETLDNELKSNLRHLKWAATDPEYAENLPEKTQNVNLTLQTMISNDHDAAPFVIDNVREVLDQIPDSEHKQQIATLIDSWESKIANNVLDTRMLDAQAEFEQAINDYELYDDDDEPHGESLDSYITDTEMFENLVADLDAEEIAMLGFAAYQSGAYPDLMIAGFGLDEDALVGNDNAAVNIRGVALKQQELGFNLQGGDLEPGQETLDGGRYEPDAAPDMDSWMRNQYPEGYSWLESGFLLADGTLLDMSYGSGQRADDHRSINPSEGAAARWGYQPDMSHNQFSRWAILSETLRRANAFRIDGQAGLLHMETAPTGPQERSIAEYINELEPEYLAIRLGDTEWQVDYPSAAQVLAQINSVAAGDGLPGTGELQEDDLVDFDRWIENNGDYVTPLDEIEFYDPDADLHINPEGYDIPAMNDIASTPLEAKLAAMNPGVHLSGDEISLLGMPTDLQLEAIAEYIDQNPMETVDIEILDENGKSLLWEQLEASDGDDWLEGGATTEAIQKYFQLMPISQERRKENLRRWLRDSKLVDDQGNPIVLYHGTARPDKIRNKFDRREATSGPMQYFTDSAKLASKYAKNKPYNQAHREEDYDYSSAFTIGGKNLTDAWRSMTPAQKQDFAEKLPLVEYDEDKEKYVLGDGTNGIISEDHLEWKAKKDPARAFGRHTVGNYITAAYDLFVMGGITYPDDDKFRQVLAAAGIPLNTIKYDDPQAAYPGVFPVFIRMRNPLQADAVPLELADAIDARAAIEQQTWEDYDGVDPWDKRSKDPEMWADTFRQAITNPGENSYVWTAIPDWATQVFREAGYDGLIDRSNKAGTQTETNNVYVPFDENQIKSAIGNSGNFSEQTGLRYAAYDEPLSEEMPELKPPTVEPQVDMINPVEFASEQGTREGLQQPTTAIESHHLEHYVHEEPKPVEQPKPDQSARDQLFEISKQQLPDHHPEDELLAPEARANMARNLDTRMRSLPEGGTWKQKEERKALLEQIKNLQEKAFPSRVSQPTGWEDDDHFYHVTAASNTESIEEEGLQIGQPANFGGSLRHNIKGNVFLTEKSGVQAWQELIGNQIAEKTELYRDRLEADLERLQEEYDQETKNEEFFDEDLINEIENIESELQQIAEHEADSENWTKTFRVPKSLLQDYVATDPIGTEDANAQAYKLNNEIVKKVRTARTRMAAVAKTRNEALVLLNELKQEEKESDAKNSDSIRLYQEAKEHLAQLGKNISDNPANAEGMSAGYERRNVQRKMWAGNQSVEWYEFYMPGMVGGDKWLEQYKKVKELGEESDRISRAAANARGHIAEQKQEAYKQVAAADILQMQLTVASQPNYWRWAKDNKAVDENGLPIIIYHGTADGGYDTFEMFDYGEHVYGSPNVNIARTYNGGFSDDVTPIRATSLDDIRASLKNSDYELVIYEDAEPEEHKYQIIGHSGIAEFEGDTEEEILAEWNNESDKSSLKLAGVYPLVFRLQDPLLVDAKGRSWNEIPALNDDWHLDVMEGHMPTIVQNQIDQKLRDYQELAQPHWNNTHKDHVIQQILNLNGENAVTPEQMLQDYATVRIAHLMPMDRSLQESFPETRPRSYENAPLNFIPTDEINSWIANLPNARRRAAWNEFIAEGDEELGFKPILNEQDWLYYTGTPAKRAKLNELHNKFAEEWNDAMETRLTVPIETEIENTEGSFLEYANKIATLLGMSTRNLLLHAFDIQETLTTREYAAQAERDGHDGIIFRNVLDDGGRGPSAPLGDVYVCFKAEQAKSAHNTSQWTEMGRDRENLLK